jgi:hypothetical protein
MTTAARSTTTFAESVGIALLTVVFLVLLPFIIVFVLPVLAVFERIDRRRALQIAEQTHCERCGHVLGKASVMLASDRWAKRMAATKSTRHKVMSRMVRQVDAVCVNCSQEYRWDKRSRAFQIYSSNASELKVSSVQ